MQAITSILKHQKRLERQIELAERYLATGKGAGAECLRPMLNEDGMGDRCPPHPDWVRNVFIPRMRRGIQRCERSLRIIERKQQERRKRAHHTDKS